MGFVPRTNRRRCPRCETEEIVAVVAEEPRGSVPLLPDKTEMMKCRRCGIEFFLLVTDDP